MANMAVESAKVMADFVKMTMADGSTVI